MLCVDVAVVETIDIDLVGEEILFLHFEEQLQRLLEFG